MRAYNQYMEEQDKHFMAMAIEAARQSKQNGDVPFGAAIVRQGRLLAVTRNTEHVDQDVTCHAETKAVSQASQLLSSRDLSGCTIYSTVEPCPMCAGAIFHSCISRVVFAISRDDLPSLFRTRNIRLWDLAKDWHYSPTLTGGVLKEEAMETFLGIDSSFRVHPNRIMNSTV